MRKYSLLIMLMGALLAADAPVRGQRADVELRLNQRFFEEIVSAIFRDDAVLEFSLEDEVPSKSSSLLISPFLANLGASCDEFVRLARPSGDKASTVKLVEGKIIAPISFVGTYDPPLLPCFDYSGTADAEISIQFDRTTQTLNGIVRASDVRLSGVPGIASGIVSRLVQSSIDKKVNPIRIIGLDVVSMNIPIKDSTVIDMKALEISHVLQDGVLIMKITYEFTRREPLR